METKECKNCLRFFPRNKIKPGAFKKQQYCSRICSLTWRNKNENPMKNPEIVNKISGENNYKWSGDLIGYWGVHNWIKKQNINRDYCWECGVPGKFFSTKKWSIEFCNLSGEYKREVNDWKCLCRKCHRKLDNSTRKEKIGVCIECGENYSHKFVNYRKRCEKCVHELRKLKNRLHMRKKRGYQGNVYKLK